MPAAAWSMQATSLLLVAASLRPSIALRSRSSDSAPGKERGVTVYRCPENASVSLPSNVQVVDAWWGSPSDRERGLNVTQEVRFRYEFERQTIPASVSLFGDPATGFAKELEVRFRREDGLSASSRSEVAVFPVSAEADDAKSVIKGMERMRGAMADELKQQERAAWDIMRSEREVAKQHVHAPAKQEEAARSQASSSSARTSTGSSGSQTASKGSSSIASEVNSFCSESGWEPEWQDEFEGDTLDAKSWKVVTSQGGFGTDRVVEDLNVTACRRASCREENVRVSGGSLHLVSERGEGLAEYFTGAVTTRGRRAWTDDSPYRLCVRAKLPKGSQDSQGIWPAIWMLPDNGYSDRCLDEGEVDMMEMVNGDGNIYSTYHWMSSWPGRRCASFDSFHRSKSKKTLMHSSWANEFHEFAIERTSKHIIFAVDGVPVKTVDASASGFELSRSPFFLILNTAIGGAWPGDPDDETTLPVEHVIDYVRVVKRPGSPTKHAESPSLDDPTSWWSNSVSNFFGASSQKQVRMPACWYINLPERRDREVRLERELHQAGVTNCQRQEGVNASLLDASGREGCRRSHIAALGQIEASGAEWGLVLEDDVEWRVDWNVTMSEVHSFFDKVNESLVDHPMLLLSCNGWGQDIADQPWLQRVTDCQTTSAYIIRKDYVPVLRDLFDQASDTNPIDMLWKTLQVQDNWAMAKPLLLYQGISYSDIERRLVDYQVFQQLGARPRMRRQGQ